MGRTPSVEIKVSKLLSLDLDTYSKFAEMVGYGNISEEIRAMIRDRVLSLSSSPNDNNVANQDTSKPNYIFQDFETKDKRDELRKYIELEPDMKKLNTLYYNCKTIVGMVEKRKVENKSLGNMESRLKNESELQDHFNKVQKAKHRSISYKDQDGKVRRV